MDSGRYEEQTGASAEYEDKAPVQELVIRELEKVPKTVKELADALKKDKSHITNLCISLFYYINKISLLETFIIFVSDFFYLFMDMSLKFSLSFTSSSSNRRYIKSLRLFNFAFSIIKLDITFTHF